MPDNPTIPTRMQQVKADQDAKIQAHEEAMAALEASDGKEARKNFFFHKNDKQIVELVNLLSSRVDAIREPVKRKAFFMAHPELEVRYSFINFAE